MQETENKKDKLFKFYLTYNTMKKINKLLPKNLFLTSFGKREKKIKKKRKRTPVISENEIKSYQSKKSK